MIPITKWSVRFAKEREHSPAANVPTASARLAAELTGNAEMQTVTTANVPSATASEKSKAQARVQDRVRAPDRDRDRVQVPDRVRPTHKLAYCAKEQARADFAQAREDARYVPDAVNPAGARARILASAAAVREDASTVTVIPHAQAAAVRDTMFTQIRLQSNNWS